jgi:hypothetical protein
MAEIFAHWEVDRIPRWPVVLRLLAGSVVLHSIAVAAVVLIPPVRDALNIASLVAGSGYVDRPYEKTRIGEDVRMVDVRERFHYPPGYFAPEQVSAAPVLQPFDPYAPKIIFEAGKAKPETSPSPTPLPSPSPLASPGSEIVAANSGTPQPSPADPAKDDSTEKSLDKIAADAGVMRPDEDEINKRPLKDWLARANELRVKGDLDLTAAVEINIEAKLSPECRLHDAVVVQKHGDARLVEVARDMVAAISDSGMLSFLRDPQKQTEPGKLKCDALAMRFSVKLDQDQVSAQVTSEADSPERASQMARGYNGLLLVGQLAKRGHDEELLYKSTRVTAQGKQIIVNFSMPRQLAGEMLKKQLPQG